MKPGATTEDTLKPTLRASAVRNREVPCLSILWHRDLRRVGERAWLRDLVIGQSVELSRLRPAFSPPGEERAEPLGCRSLSRQPMWIESLGDGLIEWVAEPEIHDILIEGEPLQGARRISEAALRRGLVVELSGELVLLFHLADPTLHRETAPSEIIGDSDAIARVKQVVAQVADLRKPVLLLGETGVGKELVARAIHACGPRAQAPFIAVNMAAITPSMAASELFGHERGAFTHAIASREGCFQQADGGTLLLDEVADTPPDVQATLLRAIETGEVQRVGGQKAEKVSVRVLAATDRELDPPDGEGPLRSALRFRLTGFSLRVPALRERPDDIGRLFVHFLRRALAETGEGQRLAPPEANEPALLPAPCIRRLVRHPWPGNVRQLDNFVTQLVIASRGQRALAVERIDDLLAQSADGPAQKAAPPPGEVSPPLRPTPPPRVGPRAIDDTALLAALRAHGWEIAPAARALGVSRNTVYARLRASGRLRAPAEIPDDEIRRAWRKSDHDVGACAATLELAARTLRPRLRRLGLV